MDPRFLSNDFSHPRHRKAVWTLVITVVVFGLLIWAYISETTSSMPADSPSVSNSAEILLAQPNPPANLTIVEQGARQQLLSKPNPPAQISPQEREARRALLENI